MKTLTSLSSIEKQLAIYATAFLLVFSACDIVEQPDSVFTPDTFYSNESAVLASLSGVYREYAGRQRYTNYRLQHMCTDQGIIHAKIQGWWDLPVWHQSHLHTWDATNFEINGVWNGLFQIVGQTNALIASLNNSEVGNLEGPIAEMQAMRAFAYFHLLDMYGNVPIFTDPKVDPNNLPQQNTRTEVFDFVVNELVEAAEVLPSQADVGMEYYGRLTKEAAYAKLAYTYLNAEVWTGTPQYDQAIEYGNRIINSGAFSLLDNYFDNFAPDNGNNAEMIFSAVNEPGDAGGIGHTFVLKSLPGITGGLFGMPHTPQNGFSSTPTAVALYENQDDRRDMFFIPGEEFTDPRTGTPVMVETIVPDGNSVLYDPSKSSTGPVEYELIPADGLRNQAMNAGIYWLKWGVDPNTQGNGQAGNDFAFIRYADVLLIKAEAILRSGGNSGEALALVNQVRERSNASTLNSITLDDIIDERGRELIFELKRRTDLIRFEGDQGATMFNDPWDYGKQTSQEFRNLFPIPQNAIDANPNLEQNPGY